MPVLSALIKALFGNASALFLAISSARLSVQMLGVSILAAAYVSCLVFFTTVIDPLLGLLFQSLYGQLIGLLFPPVSGTIFAGFSGLWGCIVLKNYYKKFGTLMLPKV